MGGYSLYWHAIIKSGGYWEYKYGYVNATDLWLGIRYDSTGMHTQRVSTYALEAVTRLPPRMCTGHDPCFANPGWVVACQIPVPAAFLPVLITGRKGRVGSC